MESQSHLSVAIIGSVISDLRLTTLAGPGLQPENCRGSSPRSYQHRHQRRPLEQQEPAAPTTLAPRLERDAALATIGVYCFTADTFLQTLREAEVTCWWTSASVEGLRSALHLGQRPALEALLAGAGIGYSHHRELAPTTELRQLQYREDDRMGVGKRSAISVPGYVSGYVKEILDPAPLESLPAEAPRTGVMALFCVECSAAACHRSLIAQRLAERHGFTVTHLLPPVANGGRQPSSSLRRSPPDRDRIRARPGSARRTARARQPAEPPGRSGHGLGHEWSGAPGEAMGAAGLTTARDRRAG